MDKLLEEWGGLDEIECRDVGLYMCLITFSSPEIKDEVLQSNLLQRYFDETRPHWEKFWSLSRWVVKFDDRTEQSKSYSVVTVLIDCYQWVRVHEWISVKIDERCFELSTRSLVRKTLPEVEKSLTSKTKANLNEIHVGDPQLDAIIECVSRLVQKSNPCSGSGGAEVEETREGMQNIVIRSVRECILDERVVWMDMDPMIHEYSIAKKISKEKSSGSRNRMMGPNRERNDGLSCSCSYPLEFGPCLIQTHSHSISVMVETLPQSKREAVIEAEGEIALLAINASPFNLVGALEGSHSEEERSDETLYRLNDETWHHFHLTDELVDSMDVGRNGQVPCNTAGVDGVDDNIANGQLTVIQAANFGLGVGVCDGLNKSNICNGSEDNMLEGYDTVSE
ncbi:hypothetical protein PIB30_017447 [Stylosanthes scabra]|uniref:Uncharacterized protein n=1 Tax=Stylosanthes scabra TaxID=79078 RepID=A0ABU6Y9G2_9FABA|nr:hypothetical protein [Stylosanthes scabra]